MQDATASKPSTQPFIHTLRVTYAHCTIGNHVYYSRYLDLLEAARGEFFRHIGFPCQALQVQDTVFQVTECHLKYLKPARYDDPLRIQITLDEVRKVRLRFRYEIHRAEEHLVAGSTLLVCVSRDERPKRIPEDLLRAFTPYIISPV